MREMPDFLNGLKLFAAVADAAHSKNQNFA